MSGFICSSPWSAQIPPSAVSPERRSFPRGLQEKKRGAPQAGKHSAGGDAADSQGRARGLIRWFVREQAPYGNSGRPDSSNHAWNRTKRILLYSAHIGFRVAVGTQCRLRQISLSSQLPDQLSYMLYLLVSYHRKSFQVRFCSFLPTYAYTLLCLLNFTSRREAGQGMKPDIPGLFGVPEKCHVCAPSRGYLAMRVLQAVAAGRVPPPSPAYKINWPCSIGRTMLNFDWLKNSQMRFLE